MLKIHDRAPSTPSSEMCTFLYRGFLAKMDTAEMERGGGEMVPHQFVHLCKTDTYLFRWNVVGLLATLQSFSFLEMGAKSWSRSYYTKLFRLVMTYSYNGARKMFCNFQEELINMSYFITISFLSFATFATFGGRFGKHQNLWTRYNYCSIPSLQCSIFSLFDPASYHPSSPRGIPHVEGKKRL